MLSEVPHTSIIFQSYLFYHWSENQNSASLFHRFKFFSLIILLLKDELPKPGNLIKKWFFFFPRTKVFPVHPWFSRVVYSFIMRKVSELKQCRSPIDDFEILHGPHAILNNEGKTFSLKLKHTSKNISYFNNKIRIFCNYWVECFVRFSSVLTYFLPCHPGIRNLLEL
jgi:hypothetical protein